MIDPETGYPLHDEPEIEDDPCECEDDRRCDYCTALTRRHAIQAGTFTPPLMLTPAKWVELERFLEVLTAPDIHRLANLTASLARRKEAA